MSSDDLERLLNGLADGTLSVRIMAPIVVGESTSPGAKRAAAAFASGKRGVQVHRPLDTEGHHELFEATAEQTPILTRAGAIDEANQ